MSPRPARAFTAIWGTNTVNSIRGSVLSYGIVSSSARPLPMRELSTRSPTVIWSLIAVTEPAVRKSAPVTSIVPTASRLLNARPSAPPFCRSVSAPLPSASRSAPRPVIRHDRSIGTPSRSLRQICRLMKGDDFPCPRAKSTSSQRSDSISARRASRSAVGRPNV